MLGTGCSLAGVKAEEEEVILSGMGMGSQATESASMSQSQLPLHQYGGGGRSTVSTPRIVNITEPRGAMGYDGRYGNGTGVGNSMDVDSRSSRHPGLVSSNEPRSYISYASGATPSGIADPGTGTGTGSGMVRSTSTGLGQYPESHSRRGSSYLSAMQPPSTPSIPPPQSQSQSQSQTTPIISTPSTMESDSVYKRMDERMGRMERMLETLLNRFPMDTHLAPILGKGAPASSNYPTPLVKETPPHPSSDEESSAEDEGEEEIDTPGASVSRAGGSSNHRTPFPGDRREWADPLIPGATRSSNHSNTKPRARPRLGSRMKSNNNNNNNNDTKNDSNDSPLEKAVPRDGGNLGTASMLNVVFGEKGRVVLSDPVEVGIVDGVEMMAAWTL